MDRIDRTVFYIHATFYVLIGVAGNCQEIVLASLNQTTYKLLICICNGLIFGGHYTGE